MVARPIARPPPVSVGPAAGGSRPAASPHPLGPSNALSPTSKAEREAARFNPKKVKLTLADYAAELAYTEAEATEADGRGGDSTRYDPVAVAAAAAAAARAAQEKPNERKLHRMHLMPLIDLVYSNRMEVQRDAVKLLGTLALNKDNVDILLSSGSVKPMLTMAASTDQAVRRSALTGLAHMTSREDVRAKLCAVPSGLSNVVACIACSDMAARLAAVEIVTNVAESRKLRGAIVRAGGLPALSSLLTSRHPELKRWGMVALQRLATTFRAAYATVEDPEGDGYAQEMVDEGVLVPLHGLLKGGPHVEEELRMLAMQVRSSPRSPASSRLLPSSLTFPCPSCACSPRRRCTSSPTRTTRSRASWRRRRC